MNPRSLAIELNANGILKPGGGGPATGGVRRPGLRSPLLATLFPCGGCPIGGGPTIPRSMLFCLANLSPPTGAISKDSPTIIPCSIILRLTCFANSWWFPPRSRSYSWEPTRGLGSGIPVEFCRCILGFAGSPGLISGTEIIFRTAGSRGR